MQNWSSHSPSKISHKTLRLCMVWPLPTSPATTLPSPVDGDDHLLRSLSSGPLTQCLPPPPGAHTCRPASASGHISLPPPPWLLCQGHCITQNRNAMISTAAMPPRVVQQEQHLPPCLLPINVDSPFRARLNTNSPGKSPPSMGPDQLPAACFYCCQFCAALTTMLNILFIV